MQSIPEKRFVRDNATWLGYLLLGATSCVMAAMGPLMPFMRDEFNMSMTVAAFHFSAWSLGGLLAGCVGDRVILRLGRYLTVWSFAALMCASLLLVVGVPNPAVTIPSIFFAGISSSIIGQCVNSLMSDRFGSQRTIGITEGNIVASLMCAAAPLAVKVCVESGFGWRGALMLIVALFVVLFVTNRQIPAEYAAPAHSASIAGHLPAAYWAYWCVIVMSVACEWSMVFWSAEFLQHIGRLAQSDAAASVTAFLAAMVIGRLIGRKLSETYSTQTLLPLAAIVGLTGFMIFWLGKLAAISIAGLFITGLGIANFYPLTLAAALGTAQGNSASATARISMGTGCSVLVMPLALGFIADHQGLFLAYGIVGGLLAVCAAMVFVANHFARAHSAAESHPVII